MSKFEIENMSGTSPSQEKLNSLLALYRSAKYSDAKKLAQTLTEKFPKYHFPWKVLGAILSQEGMNNEAIDAYQTAIQLDHQDAKSYNNLGNIFQEEGRLEESEKFLKIALKLEPDFADAHYNLGITLKDLGRLKEAEVSFGQSIAFKNGFDKAYNNLGITLKDLGRLEEAETCLRQAIMLKPDYAKAHNNLGITLKDLGRLEEAETCLRQAIMLEPEDPENLINIATVLDYMNKSDAAIYSLEKLLLLDTDNFGLMAKVRLAIFKFLKGDFLESRQYLLAASKIQERTSSKLKNDKVYQNYLVKLLNWHKDKHYETYNNKTDKTLYVIGESHSLIAHQLHVQSSDCDFLCSSKLIVGCKQWHLGNARKNQFKYKFESIIYSLPKSSKVLLAIGEIDCRLNSGIIKHKTKHPEKNIREIVSTTVENYLNYIFKINSSCHHKIIIQGVPCPNVIFENLPTNEFQQLVEVIEYFNSKLKMVSKKKNFGFLDVHKLTDRGEGLSNSKWHIDDYHLSPEGLLEAWNRYLINNQT